jgi:copper chaperone
VHNTEAYEIADSVLKGRMLKDYWKGIEKRKKGQDIMGTVIILLILAVIIVLAIRSSMKHYRGEGGCCGGGSEPKPKKKKLEGNKVAEKIIYIEGMHCENCRRSVERQLNEIDGIVANVNLKKNLAVVSMSRQVEENELREAVEKADFKVAKIEDKEV